MTDFRRQLAFVGYVVLATATAIGLLLGQGYARDTREATKENRRLALIVAGQTKDILAARRSGCEDNNERWTALGDVLRPFGNNPMASPQQRQTLADLLHVAEPRDCSVLKPKGTP